MKKINFLVNVTYQESPSHTWHYVYLTKDGRASTALKIHERKYPAHVGKLSASPKLTTPDTLSDNECHRITYISELPKGTYFRLVHPGTLKVSPTVYVRDDYDPSTKKYSAYRFDDVCHSQEFKGSRLVCIDFTF